MLYINFKYDSIPYKMSSYRDVYVSSTILNSIDIEPATYIFHGVFNEYKTGSKLKILLI